MPTEAHLVGVIVKSLRICLPFFGDPFLIVLLSLWRLFWWTMGRRKVLSQDFVRRQRKRQEIGNKKRHKKFRSKHPEVGRFKQRQKREKFPTNERAHQKKHERQKNHRKHLQIKKNIKKSKTFGKTRNQGRTDRKYFVHLTSLYFIRWFCRFICKPGAVNKPFFPINKKSKKTTK